jgi:chitodextrinase
MKLITQVYIDSNTNPDSGANFSRLDMFDFESIELTSSIKQVKEIDQVFTDFSQGFTVPASTNNNIIFQHYYSTKLVNSFDSRIKVKGFILLNGVLFRNGYFRLSKANVKKGKPYSYTLNFFGSLSGLGDVIGDDELSDLEYLNKFNHTYSRNIVYDGFTVGLAYNGTEMVTSANRDIVYPSITAIDKWKYDSSGVSADEIFEQGRTINLYSDATAPYGIDYLQLKPAIKIRHIIDAISERYSSINFTDDSFIGKPHLDNLYLLLHNTQGLLASGIDSFEEVTKELVVYDNLGNSNFTLDSGGQTERRPIITYTDNSNFSEQKRNRSAISLTVTAISPTSNIKYIVDLLDGSTVIDTGVFTSSGTLTTQLITVNYKDWRDLKYRVRSTGGLATFSATMSIEEFWEVRKWKNINDDNAWSTNNETSTYTSDIGNYTFLRELVINQHIPKIKIIDFLRGIFQKFNLIADVNIDGDIEIKTINDYFSEGNDIDITEYINTNTYDVERSKLFGNINFNFDKPQTYGIINHNEVTEDDFGNLSLELQNITKERNLLFDGGRYEVKLPFEKIYYELLSDENDLTIDTPISHGWLVDKDQKAVLTKPILFYNVNTAVDNTLFPIAFRDKNSSIITSYNRASNNLADGSHSLNFNAEIDEFTRELVTNSLFELYYKPYIQNIFDKQTRLFKIEAKFPLNFLLSYKLNDRFIIDGSPFRIDSVSTNLNDGISKLELISDFIIPESQIPDTEAPTTPTGVTEESTTTTSFRIFWTASTDNIAVTNYNIYVNGVLNKTVGAITNTDIKALSPSTTYTVRVSALDAVGNESGLSTSISITTGSISDVTAPTIPNNLRVNLIGENAITLEWDESVDDVGVTQYKVFVDDVLTSTVSTTFATLTGLTSATDYDLQVSARDAAGNESPRSSILTVTTL